MKMSKVFHDALWEYSASVTTVVAGRRRERETWMGSREDEYTRCEHDLIKLEQLWVYEKDDLEALKAIHRTFLDHYQQGRPDEGQKLFKHIDELIDNLRDKWKKV